MKKLMLFIFLLLFFCISLKAFDLESLKGIRLKKMIMEENTNFSLTAEQKKKFENFSQQKKGITVKVYSKFNPKSWHKVGRNAPQAIKSLEIFINSLEGEQRRIFFTNFIKLGLDSYFDEAKKDFYRSAYNFYRKEIIKDAENSAREKKITFEDWNNKYFNKNIVKIRKKILEINNGRYKNPIYKGWECVPRPREWEVQNHHSE